MIQEIENALQNLQAVERLLKEEWPLTESNEWADVPPPPRMADIFVHVRAARSVLEDFSERVDHADFSDAAMGA